MPRPGPRPYECVRRAWHSERHQPMRGLIIQQIFRLVHDNHSAATKKNKELQEKLPIVVLKAEEIMYSKANSETEYSSTETLWDRVNDAIDTIIRKDESAETGEFLPPCVEAALNLGCVPIRASRSQRHNNPRTFLRPEYHQYSDVSAKVLKESSISDLLPLHRLNDSVLIPGNVDSCLASSCEKLPSFGNRNIIEVNHHTSSNGGLVYPLYYGRSFKSQVCPLGLQEPLKSDSIIVGMPIFSSESQCLQKLFPCGQDNNLAKEKIEVHSTENKGKQPHVGFDLSLRLGLFSDSNSTREKSSGCGTDDLCNKVSRDKGQPQNEFSFFPVESASDHSWLHKSGGNLDSENQNVEVVYRKT